MDFYTNYKIDRRVLYLLRTNESLLVDINCAPYPREITSLATVEGP